MKRTSLIALFASVLVCSLPALAADSTRCESKVVTVGMTQAEILEYCGEPTAREVEEQPVRAGHIVTGTTTVERWTYESYSATRVFVFDQDRLVSIE
jgi:hypothetical protein